jgi:hypothetical protein
VDEVGARRPESSPAADSCWQAGLRCSRAGTCASRRLGRGRTTVASGIAVAAMTDDARCGRRPACPAGRTTIQAGPGRRPAAAAQRAGQRGRRGLQAGRVVDGRPRLPRAVRRGTSRRSPLAIPTRRSTAAAGGEPGDPAISRAQVGDPGRAATSGPIDRVGSRSRLPARRPTRTGRAGPPPGSGGIRPRALGAAGGPPRHSAGRSDDRIR